MIWSNADADSSRGLGALELAELLFTLGRRHALPFSVLALRLGSGPRGRNARSTDSRQLLAGQLRQTDILVAWGDRGDRVDWVVFCPSTTSEGAKELAQRIHAGVGDLGVAIGTASFREEALTLPDLIECAWRDLDATYGEHRGPGPPNGPLSRMDRDPPRFARPARRRRMSAWLKRSFDLAAVLAATPLWVPLAALCALSIKLSDPGAPVVFRQQRTGRGGRRFEMIKFRTMVPHAEALKGELAPLNQLSWPDFKVSDDPRITRVGRILRKTSLDELPQLLNVLSGEMSLVGPRPTSFAPETYEDWHTARLDVPPGITGLWQVEGRASTEFDERLRLDLEYVRRQGFFYDFWILLRTLPVVLTARGGR